MKVNFSGLSTEALKVQAQAIIDGRMTVDDQDTYVKELVAELVRRGEQISARGLNGGG